MSNLPFVAIVGGFFSEHYRTNPNEAKAAQELAGEIGVELRKAGFGLVVYFTDENSLEPYVVAGYCSHESETGKIKIRYSRSQRDMKPFAEQAEADEDDDLFDLDIFPSDRWESPFYRSLVERDSVDAILLMAGGTSTLIAGQIAVARQLPILAVDSFPGSAPIIHDQLASADQNRYPHWRTRSTAEHVARLRTETGRALAVRKREADRRTSLEAHHAASVSRTGHAVLCAAVFAVLCGVIGAGLMASMKLDEFLALMLFGTVAAGAMGAVVRLVVWDPAARERWHALLLGAIAGLVVGLAYLAPQLMNDLAVEDGQIAETFTGAVKGNHKIQFLLILTVAISAGVGFETIFTRLKDRATDVNVGPN